MDVSIVSSHENENFVFDYKQEKNLRNMLSVSRSHMVAEGHYEGIPFSELWLVDMGPHLARSVGPITQLLGHIIAGVNYTLHSDKNDLNQFSLNIDSFILFI